MSSYLAPLITGRYDFYSIPLQLPSPLVRALLPSTWNPPTNPSPKPKPGFEWVIIQLGTQIGTGPPFPGGKHTFGEAKLEIPFLRHPHAPSTSTTPLAFKHTLVFSTLLMSLSSKVFPGLRTAKASFVNGERDGDLDVAQWVKVEQDGGELEGDGWGEDQILAEANGWWAGHHTGATACKFEMTNLSPPVARRVKVRIHLPSFLQLDPDAVQALSPDLHLDGDGWWETTADGWWLSAATKLVATAAKAL